MVDFLTEEVDGLKKKIEQIRTERFRYNGDGLFPDNGEKILRPMRNGHEGIVFHHGRRTLDGVHDAEDGIDVVVREGVLLFSGQHDAVQLLQKAVGFKKVCTQDAVVARTHM